VGLISERDKDMRLCHILISTPPRLAQNQEKHECVVDVWLEKRKRDGRKGGEHKNIEKR
jgi:hypothetical protein